jgi:Domain of unknown function (DUF4403)
MRKIIVSVIILAVFFFGTLLLLDRFWLASEPGRRPALAAVPPLGPVARPSVVIAPVTVAHPAIRNALEARAPREIAGKQDNPAPQLLSNTDISWTVGRSPMTVAGRAGALTISTALNGTLHVTGQITNLAGDLGNTLGGLINQSVGQAIGQNLQRLSGKSIDQQMEFRGNITLTAQPTVTQNWRLEPHLSGQVSMADASMAIAGFPVNLGNGIKPLLEGSLNEQITLLQSRLHNDPFLEQAARDEWAKMCRSIPLGGAGTGLPSLWLELRPTRAFAAQPRVDTNAVILTMGVQAETRIVPTETKPNCPFPVQLEIISRPEQGRINIAVPIDVPFTEINRLLAAQLAGKTFPEDGSGSADITVRRATIAASGDRLLISLRVKGREKKSWFGFGAEVDIHLWGRPALDRNEQILRLTDLELDVESEAAFGLLGQAARAALPLVQEALAERAMIDLKPFAADAKKQIAAAAAGFNKKDPNVRIDTQISDIRLVDIAFDANTLRVIAEADGTVRVAVSSLAF